MSPEAAIAMLDRQMVAHWSSATLTRPGGATVSIMLFPTGNKADELAGDEDRIQYMETVIVSPSSLTGWTGLPRKGDFITWNNKKRSIEQVDPHYLAGTLVRLNIMIKGA